MSELTLKDKLEKLKLFKEDASWYRQNYDKLKRRYGGKYIAIHNHTIIADGNHDNLLKKLHSKRYQNYTFVIKTY